MPPVAEWGLKYAACIRNKAHEISYVGQKGPLEASRPIPRSSAKQRGSITSINLQAMLLLTHFLVFLRYQIYYGYPLQTYLEYPIIIAQDVILLLVILRFSGNMKRALLYAVTFWGGWYILTLRKWIIDLAMNLCTLISAASKLAQLRCLWQTKDSGQVSALTWSMAAYTCATRIVTTVMTTNDLAVLIRFITMLILNIWVTATILHYRKTKKTD
nr:PREDICTED: PQ-loop repeat-containing protein 3 [Opisthocomus hoazin]